MWVFVERNLAHIAGVKFEITLQSVFVIFLSATLYDLCHFTVCRNKCLRRPGFDATDLPFLPREHSHQGRT